MTQTFKQFKLTNDDEVICEVLEWGTDENASIIVRCPLLIIQGSNMEKHVRFYAFRPWMGLCDDPAILHTINSSHIIGEVNPSNELLQHYDKTVQRMTALAKVKKTDFNFDEFEDMTDEEIEYYVENKINNVIEEEKQEEEIIKSEDTDGNIIKFKPKTDTIH